MSLASLLVRLQVLKPQLEVVFLPLLTSLLLLSLLPLALEDHEQLSLGLVLGNALLVIERQQGVIEALVVLVSREELLLQPVPILPSFSDNRLALSLVRLSHLGEEVVGELSLLELEVLLFGAADSLLLVFDLGLDVLAVLVTQSLLLSIVGFFPAPKRERIPVARVLCQLLRSLLSFNNAKLTLMCCF